MRLLLIAGMEHSYIATYAEKRRHLIANKNSLMLSDADEYIENHTLSYDMILVTDGAMSANPDRNEINLEDLLKYHSCIVVITRDFFFQTPDNTIKAIISDWIRPTEYDFDKALNLRQDEMRNDGHGYDRNDRRHSYGRNDRHGASRNNNGDSRNDRYGDSRNDRYGDSRNDRYGDDRNDGRHGDSHNDGRHSYDRNDNGDSHNDGRHSYDRNDNGDSRNDGKHGDNRSDRHGDNSNGRYGDKREGKDKKEKRKWGAKPKIELEADELPASAIIDRTTSRAIVFTGHRGSGVTSTAISVALSAIGRNLKTIFVDFDTDYRAANLYLGEFGAQADKNDGISSSLIRLLAQPQKYDVYAVDADGLWVTSLGYGFADEKLLQQHFTETKIIGLITSLKHSFDLVAVDFPLDRLALTPAILNNVDVLALCMENNIYSAFTTVRNIVNEFSRMEDISYFASKANLIVTKYNDESMFEDELILPERLGELIVNEGFCDAFTTEMPVAGSIPYDNRFDRQIESDVSIIYTDNRMKRAYEGILLRLIGAAR
ncbi:MAG: hypothetical protein FWH52_02445 [Synergistaceae bacterium]|nr:hypothetical protein [Synergistaceae bacterium]